jgi:hypothetical protein
MIISTQGSLLNPRIIYISRLSVFPIHYTFPLDNMRVIQCIVYARPFADGSLPETLASSNLCRLNLVFMDI